MTKYTFIAEHEDIYGKPSGHKVSTEFTTDHINTVIENFQMFLSGVGFHTQGTLDFIPDEEYYGNDPEWNTEEWDTPQHDLPEFPLDKSPQYFDTERNK
jgi:hypothetical protein